MLKEEEKTDSLIATPLPKGWECPKCGRAIAPSLAICPFCANSASEINETFKKEGVVRVVGGGKETNNGMIKES